MPCRFSDAIQWTNNPSVIERTAEALNLKAEFGKPERSNFDSGSVWRIVKTLD
jgi:hypothetical protein